MHSHLVLLLLTLTIALISAKNLHQIDDENNSNEDQKDIIHVNDDFIRLDKVQQLLKSLQNERINQRDYDRYQAFTKRAKAIVKGDPREFMG